MANPPPQRAQRGGCLPLVLTCLASCALLALNAALINATMDLILGVFPAWLRRPKFEQTLLFVLPVLATVVQWWIVDWILFHARDRSAEMPETEMPETRNSTF